MPLILVLPAWSSSPQWRQQRLPLRKTDRVSVSYVVSKNPAHQGMYEVLKVRRVLEKLQEFLSPFRLPRTLKVSLAECNGEADAFYGDRAITICYEYIDELWKRMPAETTASSPKLSQAQ
jgi:hypothetical protein